MALTTEQVRASIVPKSDQFNADDLIAGPIVVTIKSVSQGSTEQPWNIAVREDARFYRPCKSMRRVIVHAWGDDSRQWIGKRLRMVHDPDVMFGGAKVGGIRIDALSGIDAPLELALTVSKGRRAVYRVARLRDAAPTETTGLPPSGPAADAAPSAGAPPSGPSLPDGGGSLPDTTALADAADDAHDGGPDEWRAFLGGLKTDAEKQFVASHAAMRKRDGVWS